MEEKYRLFDKIKLLNLSTSEKIRLINEGKMLKELSNDNSLSIRIRARHAIRAINAGKKYKFKEEI